MGWSGLPCDIDEAACHGTLLAVLVALDRHAVQVAGLPGDPAGGVQVLAHHDLAEDLQASKCPEPC